MECGIGRITFFKKIASHQLSGQFAKIHQSNFQKTPIGGDKKKKI